MPLRHLLACLLWCTASVDAGAQPATWTDPAAAARDNPDFLVQGEYAAASATHAVQVVAMGDGAFSASIHEGGLPGAGATPGAEPVPMSGQRRDQNVELATTDGRCTARIRDGVLTLQTAGGASVQLPRVERQSPTLGAKPPAGAVVLFDGKSAEAWERGLLENGLLKANNSTSKPRFRSYSAHLEFRTPFKPAARGQKRGNSGIYHAGRWETQVLDSFGLEPRDNDCGGIYSVAKPRLNMCLPPLSWQTYDVDFTAATFDANGQRTAWPRITVKLNGVLIHDDIELAKDFTTSAPITSPLTDEPGPMFLQDHQNPVLFRNIWVLPK